MEPPKPPEPPAPPKPRRRRRALIVLGVLVGLFAAFDLVVYLTGTAAYARAQERFRGLGGPASFVDLAPDPIPEGENAAVLFREMKEELDGLGRREFPWDAEDNDAFLRENAGLLARVHAALDLPASVWETDFTRALEVDLPPFLAMRGASRLMATEAWRLAESGDLDGAWTEVRRLGRLVDHVMFDRSLISVMISLSLERGKFDLVQRIGRDRDLSPAWDGALLDARDYRRMLRDAFIAEAASVTYTIERLGQGDMNLEGERAYSVLAVLVPGWRPHDTAVYLGRMCDFIEMLDGKALPEGWDEFPAWSLLARILVPGVGRTHLAADGAQACSRMARAALDLRGIRIANGAYPDEWEAPADPNGAGPLGYRREGDGFVLWSVGEDGVDDAGGGDDLAWTWNR